MDGGPLPDWLDAAVRIVLADMQRPTPVDIELTYEAGDSWGTLFVRERGDERALTSIPVSRDAHGADLLVEIADGLQEQVFPELRGSWGEARPECPGHTHPAEPRAIADEAWWVCPRDGRQIRPFGG